jgi:hypothetical protein
MRARGSFLTSEWQRPNPPPSSLPVDRTIDASEIWAKCTTEGSPHASSIGGAPSEPIDVTDNETMLAGIETKHLESLLGCLTALDEAP